MFNSLKSMENDKSPEDDRLSKEFYECLWKEIKKPFLASSHKAFLNQELCSSQKQSPIKMLEKKYKDRRFIKNWRPISLFNRNIKITQKVLSTRNILPFLKKCSTRRSSICVFVYRCFRNIFYIC